MGIARLNVWISERSACEISQDAWSVWVTYCDGSPLRWCEVKSPFPAPCGHADIRLPPGCYVVFALRWTPGTPPLPFPRLTDSVIVTVGCDETACVHLYRRTDRQHLHAAANAVERLAQEQSVPRDKAMRLRESVTAVLEHLPRTEQDMEHEDVYKQAPTMTDQKPGAETS